jgi:hypothetical protein
MMRGRLGADDAFLIIKKSLLLLGTNVWLFAQTPHPPKAKAGKANSQLGRWTAGRRGANPTVPARPIKRTIFTFFLLSSSPRQSRTHAPATARKHQQQRQTRHLPFPSRTLPPSLPPEPPPAATEPHRL